MAGVVSVEQEGGCNIEDFDICKTVRVTKSRQVAETEVKGRAQNDKTRAQSALRHIVILCSNTSILTAC